MNSTELREKRQEVAARLATLTADAESDDLSTGEMSAVVAERQAAAVVLATLDEKIRQAEIAERRAIEAEKRQEVAALVAEKIPAALAALVGLDAALTALSDAASRDTIAPADSREVMAGLLLLKRHVDDTLTDMRRRNVDGIPAPRPAPPARPAVKDLRRLVRSGPLQIVGGRSVSTTVDVRAPLLR